MLPRVTGEDVQLDFYFSSNVQRVNLTTCQRMALCPVTMGDPVLVLEDMYGMPFCTSLLQLTYFPGVVSLFR